MSKWETKTVDVMKDLHLDPHNVRLELDPNAPEPDIILDLFQNEAALDLVEGIVKVGYLTHEVPIVIRRQRRFYVVEGNRRVAALKAIHNPQLVEDFQARIYAKIEGFTGRDGLKLIEVKVAPNQAEADQLVAALHAGNLRRPWSPARQAAFFQAQIDAGRTLRQLKANYPLIEVEKYVLRSAILEKFRAVKYLDPELTDFVRGRSLKPSTLARLYESKEFIDLTGLKLDSAGNLKCKLARPVFAAVAEVIVRGMHEGSIDTRSIGKVSNVGFQVLMRELTDLVARGGKPPSEESEPDGSSGGEAESGSGGGSRSGSRDDDERGGSGSEGGAGRPGSGTGSGSRRRKRSFLDVSDLNVPAGYPVSIELILEEFATLNVDKYPNAAFDLLRTLLEKTIKSFADSKNKDLKPSGNNGYVYLSNCLSWLEDWFTANGPKAQVQVVKKVRSGMSRDFQGSVDLLNAINHNHFIHAEGDDVRSSWNMIRSLIAEMLK